MRPGMRHPPPAPPLRPPPRLIPAPNDGGVFFGGRDYARRQQQNYPPQKPLLPPPAPPQQWQNNPNFRGGPIPLIRPGGPWHPHGNSFHSPSPPPPPPLLHPHHQPFNPNAQTPITYVPPNASNYELMRLANTDQIPFLEPHEDEDALVRQHLASNNSNNDESLGQSTSSPSKSNKRRRNQQQQQQQHENNRNVISYQDLDRPDEQRDPSFVNRMVSKTNKTNHLPSDKTNNQSAVKSSANTDLALKLELDRIKKAGAQEREKLRAQRQAAAEREAKKRNSAKPGDHEKREDGELGDSSDDENTKANSGNQPKRLTKIVDNLALQSAKSMGSLYRSKTPPSESILDMSVMKLMRPMKLFHLDDDQNSSYREYLTTNFGRVRVHCQKPQPNFFSNLGCIEEIKRRLRLNNNASTSLLFRHLLDDNDQDVLMASSLAAEPEDGEIESDEEKTPVNANGKGPKSKSVHNLSDDENEKQVRKKSKLNDDGTGDLSKSTSSEKPWMTTELRVWIKQRNKLQAQILNGETTAEIEKKFKKIRNKISKHAKTLKAKYENSISGSNEPSLAPPNPFQQLSAASSAAAVATAANHPLSTILDPALVMAMLVNPSLYSHVQQQVLSNPNFMQACQHMFVDGGGAASSKSSSSHPSKVASETQVVPSNSAASAAIDDLIKQATLQKSSKEQQNIAAARSRPVLTQATKPIQLTSLETDTDAEQRNKSTGGNRSRFNSAETSLTESQQQEIALTQELIRRQLALTQQQPRNQRNSHSAGQSSISSPLSRHIPLSPEQMQEVLTRAKNYVTRQQTDEPSDSMNNPPRLSYNTRRLQAAMAASASSATPQTAHTIGQAAAAAIAAVSNRPSTSIAHPPPVSSMTNTTAAPPPQMRTQPPPNVGGASAPAPMPPGPQQHPIRIQLDQKSKTLSSISNNQSLPIPTISQQKLMPLIEMKHSAPPHMYSNPPNWQRPPPPHLAGPHYPHPPQQQQQHQQLPPQRYPLYDNPHPPPYYGPRVNYPPDMRPPPSYGPLPPRHLSQPPRYNGPLPPPGPYGYGHPGPNYGPSAPPRPHYGHPYPPS